MDSATLFQLLRKRFDQDTVIDLIDVADPYVKIASSQIQAVCTYLRYNPETQYAVLSNLTAVDYPAENRIDLVYHLYSFKHKHFSVLKTSINRDNPEIDSIEGVWKLANWFEREIYDLFGVHFRGHSNLKRLLMPDDWKGFPLRKDYREEPEYHNIPTTREEPLKVLKGDRHEPGI